MATPNTTFSSGAVLTAEQVNSLPFGIMARQSISTAFNTSAPHTTLQANGATLTITEVSGRLYRINYSGFPYPSGGQQSICYSFTRAGVGMKDSNVFTNSMSTLFAPNITNSFLYLSTASGSVTWTMRMSAFSANTTVTDFGNATSIRQFWIEDLGKP
jgi:hypothetical protein